MYIQNPTTSDHLASLNRFLTSLLLLAFVPTSLFSTRWLHWFCEGLIQIMPCPCKALQWLPSRFPRPARLHVIWTSFLPGTICHCSLPPSLTQLQPHWPPCCSSHPGQAHSCHRDVHLLFLQPAMLPKGCMAHPSTTFKPSDSSFFLWGLLSTPVMTLVIYFKILQYCQHVPAHLSFNSRDGQLSFNQECLAGILPEELYSETAILGASVIHPHLKQQSTL